jgi:hypothetical protein
MCLADRGRRIRTGDQNNAQSRQSFDGQQNPDYCGPESMPIIRKTRFYMTVGKVRGVMNQEEYRQQIDEDDRCRGARCRANHDKDRTDAVAKRGKG